MNRPIALFLLIGFLGAFTLQACGRKMELLAPVLSVPTPTAPCGYSVHLDLVGNLNSAEPVGFVDIMPSGAFPIPLSVILYSGPNYYNVSKLQTLLYNTNGLALKQTADPCAGLDSSNPQPFHTTPLLYGGLQWNRDPNIFCPGFEWGGDAPSPACSAVRTVVDGAGNNREITFRFFQVTDLGRDGINQPPNDRAIWAWYAFETTDGAPITKMTFLGGSAVVEGFAELPCSMDRGKTNYMCAGDLLCFNTDGSLATEGAFTGPAGDQLGYQVKPYLYLQAVNGAPVTRVEVNFGTAGTLGHGLRDGLTGDLAPSSVR